MGGQGLADRSRMGIRRARRSRRRRVRLGRRIHAGRQAHGQYLARRISAAESLRRTATSAHRRSPPFRRMATACYDMIGNVWEWTADWYSQKHEADAPKACCIPENPRGGAEAAATTLASPESRSPAKCIKGGSHLCAPNYCRRYRPAARHAEAIDTSTSHVGFRCVIRNNGKKTRHEQATRAWNVRRGHVPRQAGSDAT